MKTVMKKMFSLLLVAVLMVGVMPFQAFADDTQTTPVTVTLNLIYESGGKTQDTATIEIDTSGDIFSQVKLAATGRWNTHTFENASSAIEEGNQVYAKMTCNHTKTNVIPAVAATCTTTGLTEGATCDFCGETVTSQVEIPAIAHGTAIADKVDPTCTDTGLTSGTYCPVCEAVSIEQEVIPAKGHVGGAAATCTTAQTCTVCGETLAVALGHSVNDTTGKCTRCGKDFSQTTTTVAAGTSQLYVWANLYVGDTYQDTVLIDTITGLSGSEKIYQVISDNRTRIVNKFPEGYSNDSWSNNVYYSPSADTLSLVTSSMTVGGEDDAIINLYANQKLVIARVHLSKSYAVDLAVQVNGFQVGDIVTESHVKAAVKKYYNVSSMKIYTYSEWEKVVAGKDANNITNFQVQGGDSDNIYEVYVSGSRITSSSSTTYTADSSNPKTGDMIFVPAAVLGLSASALAVLFFLNKKRAF